MAAGHPPTGLVGVVGLGLIGGSVALDALARGRPVLATDTDERQRAAAAGAGVPVVDDLPSVVAAADLVVVAVPAPQVAPVLVAVDRAATRRLLATSVASVQGAGVLGTADLDLRHVAHLGGHPMTGTERSGFRAARRGMFDGSPWIVTATPGDLVGDLRAVVDLARGLGATPVVVPPDEHDRTVALLSHLPHVLAYATYARLRAEHDHGVELLAGGSFRDLTRVAATRPSFWSEVLGLNRRAVAAVLGEVRASLAEAEALLAEGTDDEAIEAWLDRGHREVGRPRPAVPPPTTLPADDQPIGDDAFALLREHTRAGLSLDGWTATGAARWAPL